MLSESAVVIDALNFISDGDPADLRAGGVHAANVTITSPTNDLRAAIDDLAAWLRRLRDPASGWRLVEKSADILAAKAEGRVALIMGWQNVLPLEDQLDRIALFHRLGIRVIQLSYNDATKMADGCLERRNGGLTELGRRAVAEMNACGVAIDLSHCAEASILDAATISTDPVFLTHICASNVFQQFRNRSDAAIRAVAERGGVIGLSIHGFMNWDGDPAHPPSVEGFVTNVRHVFKLVGVEHVGIGTDLPCLGNKENAQSFINMTNTRYAGPGGAGNYVKAFGKTLASRYPKEVPDPSHFGALIAGLERGGFTAAEIEKIAGGNFLRVFGQVWDR